MNELSTQRLGDLRKKVATLTADHQRLESQRALLEKQLEQRDDPSTRSRFEACTAKLEAADAAVSEAKDELASCEESRAEHAATIEELEHLVDSFGPVVKELPELAELLTAMRLCVGALASARRLQRTHEHLPEPRDIGVALTEALMRLASTLSSRAQVKALAGKS